MAAVGLLQYGFGAVVGNLMARHGWSFTQVFVLLAVWAVCQAGVGFPVAVLRERRGVAPRPIMLAAAVLCLVGLLALAHGSSLLVALLGYSVLAGGGAGMVYGTCTSSIAKWFPEQANSKVSMVTGAFAYGTALFAVAAVVGLDQAALAKVLDVAAVVLFVVVAGCGMFFRDPPARWWPAYIDPKEWALRHAPGRRANMPAVRQYSPGQALRTRALSVMYLIAIGAGAVSLFDAAFIVVFMARIGAVASVMALSVGLLFGINGLGRALAIRISDRLGRSRTLKIVLLVQGIGQLLLAMAASSGSAATLVLAAAVAGCGGGAFYPLVASLVGDYFGHQRALEVHALVYSAKAFAGVIGVGLAAFAVASWGFAPVFLLAGCVSFGAAAAILSLHRPGLPNTLPGLGTGRRAGWAGMWLGVRTVTMKPRH
jgi:MFS family permease